MLAHARHAAEADDRARARRGLRRRRRTRRLLRHRDRRAGRDLRAVGGEARADPGDDQPLRGRGDRRAAGAALFPDRRAFQRRGGVPDRLVHDIVPAGELDARINELLGALRRRRTARAGGSEGADPRGRAPADRRRGDRRHGGAHRARPRVAGRPRKASRPSSASARRPGCRAALRSTNEHASRRSRIRHLAADRAGGGARLGERHPALRGAVHRRRSRLPRIGSSCPAASRRSRIRWCSPRPASCSASSSSPTRFRASTRCGTSCTRSSAFRRAPRSRPACSAIRPPAATLAAAILGGTLAAGSHFAKAGGRAVINTSPEPFSNWAASFGEDLAVGTRALARVRASARGARRARGAGRADDLADAEAVALHPRAARARSTGERRRAAAEQPRRCLTRS